MFGLKYLTNYVGEITFFRRLPSMMGTDPLDPSGDPRPDVVLPLLLRRCCAFRNWDSMSHRRADEEQQIAREVKSISQTLGNGLLGYINATFAPPLGNEDRIVSPYCHSLCPRFALTRCASHADHHRKTNVRSVVQEIKALKLKLDATADEDEQRVLEEDVTGKILWFCWCGICAEVEELLPEVLSYIRREKELRGLFKVGRIVGEAHVELDDDLAHLQRMMLDIGVGTSKHRLLLETRAAERIKWSGATISTDTSTLQTQVAILESSASAKNVVASSVALRNSQSVCMGKITPTTIEVVIDMLGLSMNILIFLASIRSETKEGKLQGLNFYMIRA
ncbi:hypothetical protein EV401DRAFT_1379578 [Pisolithus croceorrhizus]|nr:hypothetical protein EV401DRAFT_1379578 [Pisolithus croceorrhizus]